MPPAPASESSPSQKAEAPESDVPVEHGAEIGTSDLLSHQGIVPHIDRWGHQAFLLRQPEPATHGLDQLGIAHIVEGAHHQRRVFLLHHLQ